MPREETDKVTSHWFNRWVQWCIAGQTENSKHVHLRKGNLLKSYQIGKGTNSCVHLTDQSVAVIRNIFKQCIILSHTQQLSSDSTVLTGCRHLSVNSYGWWHTYIQTMIDHPIPCCDSLWLNPQVLAKSPQKAFSCRWWRSHSAEVYYNWYSEFLFLMFSH